MHAIPTVGEGRQRIAQPVMAVTVKGSTADAGPVFAARGLVADGEGVAASEHVRRQGSPHC